MSVSRKRAGNNQGSPVLGKYCTEVYLPVSKYTCIQPREPHARRAPSNRETTSVRPDCYRSNLKRTRTEHITGHVGAAYKFKPYLCMHNTTGLGISRIKDLSVARGTKASHALR